MISLGFNKKKAIVTGADKGIGRAIAEALLTLNCSVMITSPDERPDWCNEYQFCEHRRVDFLDSESVKYILSEIDLINSVDILINNAGIQIPQPIFALSEEDWDKTLKVNLYSAMLMTRAVTCKMKKVRMGKILNISSIAGIVSKPAQSAYSASKAGLIGLTRSSALDMAPYNILVNALCPGPTLTDMIKELLSNDERAKIEARIPLGRFARVEEIANVALFLCSDLNTYITGQAVVIAGGALSQ